MNHSLSKPIAVIAEDRLTEAVLNKCVASLLPEYKIVRSEFKGGRGHIQRELMAYAKLSSIMPVLVGIDLDSDECAPSLLRSWAVIPNKHSRLILRVAVTEVEAWILADRKRFAAFIDATSDEISSEPDLLTNPKLSLLMHVKACASDELKADLLPKNFNRYPRIGRAYNLRMCEFVGKQWRPHVAQQRSPSLRRAVKAISAIR